MYYVSIIADYLKTYMKTRMTYRADFWIEVVSDLAFQAMNLFFILVVFQHTNLLAGWSREEIIFVYGYFMVPYGIFSCFFNLWDFSERYIIKGEMDRVLTRPAHNLVQLVLENADPPSLFGSVTGLLVMGYAGYQMGLQPAWYDFLVLGLLVAGSSMIYGGIYIALTAISFFSDSRTSILPMMWNIQNYGRYPVDIYNKAIKMLLTWVLPFAFVGVYPAAYFLDKDITRAFSLLTPLGRMRLSRSGHGFLEHGGQKISGSGFVTR